MSTAWYVGWCASIVLVACGGRSIGPSDADLDADAGSGGEVEDGTGGRDSVGGKASRGGANSRGGSDARGGANSRGGSDARGGANSRGGSDARGGANSRGGSDARGGSSDGVPRCVPGQMIACACADAWEGSQTCNDDGRYDPCVCAEGTLDWFRVQIVGEWAGTRTTPWQEGELPVTLEFTDEGTWSGTCVSEDACPVLYYGSDDETSENTYRFTSVNDDRYAYGRITLTWPEAGITEGDLRDVHFEADGTKLYFDFWATWAGEYGPVSFALTRQ